MLVYKPTHPIGYSDPDEESETLKRDDQAVNTDWYLINNINHRPHFSRRVGYIPTTFISITFRYTVPESPTATTPEDVGPAGVGPAAGGGPVVGGYGVEVVGQAHRPLGEGEVTAVVYLPRDTRYKLRLSNANNHLIMVRVEIDDVHVGKFMANCVLFSTLKTMIDSFQLFLET